MGALAHPFIACAGGDSVGLSACGRRGSWTDRSRLTLRPSRPVHENVNRPRPAALDRSAPGIDLPRMHHFAYRRGVSHQNVLHAEEVDLTDLAAAVGTPFYCYSSATLERHYRVFADAFAGQPGTLVCYSIKANSNLGVLATLADSAPAWTWCPRASSPRARGQGRAGADRVFGSRQDAGRDGRRARRRHLSLQCRIGAGAQSAERGGREQGATARIAFRVNPDVDAKTHHKIATGKAENKFGVPFAQAPRPLRAGEQLPGIEASGVHMHIGSQITDLSPFRNAFALLHELVADLRAKASPSPSSISAAVSASPIATISRRRRSRPTMRVWCRRNWAGSACGSYSSLAA